MSKILVATMPIPGHVAPFASIVRELIKRGHEVMWYTSKLYQEKVEATGAHFRPILSAVDFGDSDYNRHFPERATLHGLNQVRFDFIKLFIGSAEGHLTDLRALLSEFKPEVLFHDTAVIGAAWLGVTKVIPTAQLNISALHYPDPVLAPFGLGLMPDGSPLGRLRNRLLAYVADNIVFGSVNKAARETAQRAGMPFFPIKPTPSPYLTLQPSVPELEYPHEVLDRTVHFIGALLPEARNFTPPAWWEQVVNATKPVVLVTQGTVATNPDELLKPTLAGLAAEDAIVIATTGSKTAAELGLTVPSNARVETFVPFVPIMPHVDVFITNGGYGGFVVAMAHGVPTIAGGVSEDKVEVNNRLVYTGAGINLKTATPTPEKVREAYRRVIAVPSFKQKAGRIQMAFAAKNAPIEGANLLEELIRRRAPIQNGRG